MAPPKKSPVEETLDKVDKREVDIYITYHYQYEGEPELGEGEEQVEETGYEWYERWEL